jgi:hypothetical protein
MNLDTLRACNNEAMLYEVSTMGPAATLGYVHGVTTDPSGNIYVAHGHLIGKFTPAGVFSNFVGSYMGFWNAAGSNAAFGIITSIACDISGNICRYSRQ